MKLYKKNALHFFFSLIMLILMGNDLCAQAEIQLNDRENYAELANIYFKSGNWNEAKKIIEEGVKRYPKDSDLKMLLGKYYFEQEQNYELARYELLKALEYNKNNLEAKHILVNVEIGSQRFSSATCYVNELLEANPYGKELWMKKIEIYRLQNNDVEANRLLKRLRQVYPEDNEIKTAYLYYLEEEIATRKKEGEINKVIDLAAILVEENPYNEDSYIELINNYLKAGDTEKALVTADRGLYNMPDNVKIIDKKIDILGELHNYEDLLAFIKLKAKNENNKVHLENRYNYFLQESAQHYRKTSPYTIYSMLFERSPQNQEAFNYVVTHATAMGLYEDALIAIKKAKQIRGEKAKDLLLLEQEIYRRMGNESKFDQLTVKLFGLYPEDSDIKEQYIAYRFKQGKINTQEELYEKALNHWRFVIESTDDKDMEKSAMSSMHNCHYQLKDYDKALSLLDRLCGNYPQEYEWQIKKAVIYGDQQLYSQSLGEYENVIKFIPSEKRERLLIGYDELATIYTKRLMEGHRLEDALDLVKRWLIVYPQSELGNLYAISLSSQMGDYASVERFALQGLENNRNNLFFTIKLAEVYNMQNEHKKALDILSPAIVKNPYHRDLISAYSQASEDYAKDIIYITSPEEGIVLLNNALRYDPDNKSLSYWKGIAHEKNKEYDSAYHYMSNYEPSAFEVKAFTRHLDYIKSKTYKNQVSASYQRYKFADVENVTGIATAEYTRFAKRNTYTGRVNYTGRDTGKGIQVQAEWTCLWKPDFYSTITMGGANDYFAKFMVNANVYKVFKYNWEAQLGAGYRSLVDDNNMFNVVAGVAKDWEPWWLNARFSSVILDGDWYYNLMGQARYYITDNGYVTALASIGSAPDIGVVDNQLYSAFSVTNTMVGLGAYYMLNRALSVGLLGSWYNYEDVLNIESKYRNVYNIQFQLYVSF